MAADIRPFKSKEQDGQGNEVIIRDQQLVEQTSQTTMASGEYFEIVDVDGRMAKIPKDNMINVVREALGSLLNGLADQTTVTKALTLNGDTLGASTAATLASVLGVLIGKGEIKSGDCNSLACGLYNVRPNEGTIQNVPVQDPFFLMVTNYAVNNTYYKMQMAVVHNSGTLPVEMYIRLFQATWTGWAKVTTTNI